LHSTGIRWIDPNGGCKADSIQVHCNFDTMETCVYPTKQHIENGTHYVGEPPASHVYYGEDMT